MLATEPSGETNGTDVRRTLLETWGANERMRHIPPVAWMIEKLDVDVRRSLDACCAPVEMLFADDANRIGADKSLRVVCAALERLAEVAKHSRGGGAPPHELSRHVIWSLNHAVAALRTLDADLIGRRLPFHTFERSKAEPLYAALLVVLVAMGRLVDSVRDIDPEIDGRLLEKLIHLELPLPEDPIA